MVNHLFASLLHSSFISIGGEISLDSIPSITKEISDLKEELMIYASLNNILNYVEDVNSLKELIKLPKSKMGQINKQSYFSLLRQFIILLRLLK